MNWSRICEIYHRQPFLHVLYSRQPIFDSMPPLYTIGGGGDVTEQNPGWRSSVTFHNTRMPWTGRSAYAVCNDPVRLRGITRTGASGGYPDLHRQKRPGRNADRLGVVRSGRTHSRPNARPDRKSGVSGTRVTLG